MSDGDAHFQAGVSATVVDARFCKPLDTHLLRQLAQQHPAMITVEEGSIGGFAAHVMQVKTQAHADPAPMQLFFRSMISVVLILLDNLDGLLAAVPGPGRAAGRQPQV